MKSLPAWTDEQIEILRNTPAFLKISDVAALFPNKTKNAVIGKLHRMGLYRNKKKIKNAIRRIKNIVNKKSECKPIKNEHLFEEFTETTISLFDVRAKHCRFPLGSLKCCGADIVLGSYCQYHFDITHRKAKEAQP